ncbi:MAG: hypothetical protein ILP12_01990 [Lachnospiraceae bacterium]|nr:hypothetical protein [Lachnospiraceae bacterium]
MKTDVITVRNTGARMEEALQLAEKVAVYKNLSHKDALHLRLLAEEAMGMFRSIAGDVTGRFWIEDDEKAFQIHLQVKTDMDEQQRRQLISASSSGKNEATRGLMGKIRAFFEPVESAPAFFDMAPMYDMSERMYINMEWSMRAYREQLQDAVSRKRRGAAAAWDELEKSVISNIADDVKVSVYGRDAELIIYKKFA